MGWTKDRDEHIEKGWTNRKGDKQKVVLKLPSIIMVSFVTSSWIFIIKKASIIFIKERLYLKC